MSEYQKNNLARKEETYHIPSPTVPYVPLCERNAKQDKLCQTRMKKKTAPQTSSANLSSTVTKSNIQTEVFWLKVEFPTLRITPRMKRLELEEEDLNKAINDIPHKTLLMR